MEMVKKFKCVHCNGVVECNDVACVSQCTCGKVKTRGGVIVEGANGIDYVDVSQKLILG